MRYVADVTVLTETVNCDSGLYVLIGLAKSNVIRMFCGRMADNMCKSSEKKKNSLSVNNMYRCIVTRSQDTNCGNVEVMFDTAVHGLQMCSGDLLLLIKTEAEKADIS